MAHPQMFDDGDPILAGVGERALALPEADVKVSHGRPAFFTRKVFAYYGGSQRIDGAWVAHDQAVMVLPDPGDRPALLEDPRVWSPAYLGPSGWIGLDLGADPAQIDWDELAELLDASYRLTASARLVRLLDASA